MNRIENLAEKLSKSNSISENTIDSTQHLITQKKRRIKNNKGNDEIMTKLLLLKQKHNKQNNMRI